MIVTDKFVFVHLPRTGGTFVTEVIHRFFPSAHEVGHHMPRRLLPKEYSHLPVFGTVRDPWEFYVSLYHYMSAKNAKSVLASWMSENGKLGFEGSVRNLVNLGFDNERLDALIAMLPETIDYSKRQMPNVSKTVTRSVRDTGVGYYTFRLNEMFGNTAEMHLCRLENLAQDLLAFFQSIGVMSRELQDYVIGSDKKNSSEHLHYSTYYSAELAELVAVRDRQIIDRFGYRFKRISCT